MFYTHLTHLLMQGPLWAIRSAFDRDTITLLRHREALGDTLMLTPLVRGLKKALPKCRVAVATRRKEVFIKNPNIDELRDWHLWRTKRTVRAHYGPDDLEDIEHVVLVQWRNLWKELTEAGLTDTDTPPKLPGLQPELFLTDEEKAKGRDDLLTGVPLAMRDRPVILVSSGGKRKPVHNREWGVNNYQAVVNALLPHTVVIQVGGDEALYDGERRLVNMSKRPVRETAAIFLAADALLLQEGGLHHLARAVEAPSVVIFGGSVLPKQTGYDKQLNLSKRTDCSPCLSRRENCLHMKCMATITPRRVAEALEVILETRDKKLAAEAMDLAPDSWEPPAFIDRIQYKTAVAANGSQDDEPDSTPTKKNKAPIPNRKPRQDTKPVSTGTKKPESKRVSRRTSKRVSKPASKRMRKPDDENGT